MRELWLPRMCQQRLMSRVFRCFSRKFDCVAGPPISFKVLICRVTFFPSNLRGLFPYREWEKWWAVARSSDLCQPTKKLKKPDLGKYDVILTSYNSNRLGFIGFWHIDGVLREGQGMFGVGDSWLLCLIRLNVLNLFSRHGVIIRIVFAIESSSGG